MEKIQNGFIGEDIFKWLVDRLKDFFIPKAEIFKHPPKKGRELKDCLNDLLITSYRDGEFMYVNAEMIIEAIEIIIDKYHETDGDWIDDLYEILDTLKKGL